MPFHKSNSEDFPAHGNAKGKTAGCKIDLAFDLISGDILSNQLHIGTQQDKTSGEDLLVMILSNDLILRDMGYFVAAWFARIEEASAFWLNRVPLNVNMVGENGKSIEKILASHRGGQVGRKQKNVAAKSVPRPRRKEGRQATKTCSSQAGTSW